MTNDPLSEILDLLDARCLMSGGLAGGGHWIRRFPQPNAIKVMAIVEGNCWLVMDSVGPPVRIEAGDVAMVNGKHALTLVSDLDQLALPENSPTLGVVRSITRLTDHPETVILGGHVAVDPERQSLLLDVLPPLIHIRNSSEEAQTLRWLLDQLARERDADRPGAASAIAQLAQLMFVQALRAHLSAGGPAAQGWLNGLGDERIAPALGLMHAEPAKAWTLGELAKAVGMSRTSFALRFKTVVGIAPLAYLTQWRMHLAERDLRQSDLPVSGIAYRLGYTSESAFSNAFKRLKGVAPRPYRTAGKDILPIVPPAESMNAF